MRIESVEGIAELKAILSIAEHIHALVVEVAVEFCFRAHVTPLVQVSPYGSHRRHVSCFGVVVGDDALQISVDGIEHHAVEVVHHRISHTILFVIGEGVSEQYFLFLFFKLFGRNGECRCHHRYQYL